jgi:hypothetical protein
VTADLLVGTLVRARPATLEQSRNFSRRFAVGQTLKGIVLRALPEGQMLVNLAGQHVLLELNQPLARGQTFLAIVEQSSPTLMLKVIDAPGAQNPAGLTAQQVPVLNQPDPGRASAEILSAARLKSYLVAKQPFGDMVSTLQKYFAHHPLLRALDPALHRRLEETLTALLPQKASPPDAAELKEQIDRSGINYEAKVQHLLTSNASPAEQAALMQDLKGQLLELMQELNQAPHTTTNMQAEEAGELRQHVQQALQNIEFHQLSNLFAQQEHQFLLLQFIHPAFPTSHTAKLYFRVDSHEEGAPQEEKQYYTLVFLLDFTALGPVRVDATVRGTRISATIRTKDEAVATFITAQTPTLTARLHALGFQAEVQCCVHEYVPLDVDDSLTRLLMTDPSQLLDITV